VVMKPSKSTVVISICTTTEVKMTYLKFHSSLVHLATPSRMTRKIECEAYSRHSVSYLNSGERGSRRC